MGFGVSIRLFSRAIADRRRACLHWTFADLVSLIRLTRHPVRATPILYRAYSKLLIVLEDFRSSARVSPFSKPSATTTAPSAASSSWTTSATASSSSAIPATSRLFPRFVFRLWRVVDEKRVKRKTIGQNKISYRTAPDVDCIERQGLAGHAAAFFRSQFHGSEGCIHLWRDGGDGAGDDGAVLELDRDGLVLALHEESIGWHVSLEKR